MFILILLCYLRICCFFFSFSENAKRVSSLFRDRPMTPSESVVYWVEYLIRHAAEASIRPLSADASWTSHFMLDMCAALAAAFLTLWFVTRAVIHVVLYKFIPSTVKWCTSTSTQWWGKETNRVVVVVASCSWGF